MSQKKTKQMWDLPFQLPISVENISYKHSPSFKKCINIPNYVIENCPGVFESINYRHIDNHRFVYNIL